MKESLPIIHSVSRQEKVSEEGKQKVSGVVDEAFQNVMRVLGRALTVMDMHAFPADILKKDYLFKMWFEKEIFPLETDEDFARFTGYIKLAFDSLSTGRLSVSGNIQFSRRVQKLIAKGFTSLEDVIVFFRFVAQDQEKYGDEFIVNEKTTKSRGVGGERYSACRILKRGLAIFAAENHIKSLRDWVEYLLTDGVIPGGMEKGGVLSGITSTGKPSKILDLAEKRESLGEFYDWLAVGESLDKPIFVIERKSHTNIARIEIGFKDNRKAIEKLERSGKVAASEINELFRIRVILKDTDEKGVKKSQEENAVDILDMMEDVEESLGNSVTSYDVDVESRDKNYLSLKQKKVYFKYKEDDGKNEYEDGLLNRMVLKPLKYNTSSGAEYKAMTQKILFLSKTSTQKAPPETVFGFEIQYVTESDHTNNENEKTSGGHFMMELRNFAKHFARMESVMTRDEILDHCRAFLDFYKKRYIDETPDEFLEKRIMKFPTSLKGDFKKLPGWKSKRDSGKFQKGGIETGKFSMDFGNKVCRAEAVFEFLHAEGKLIKVPQDFPRVLRATDRQLANSNKYMGAQSYENILKVMEAE